MRSREVNPRHHFLASTLFPTEQQSRPSREMVMSKSDRGFFRGKDLTMSQDSNHLTRIGSIPSQASVERLAAIIARPVRSVVVGPSLGKGARFGTRSRQRARRSRRTPLGRGSIEGEEVCRLPSAGKLNMQKNLRAPRDERRRIIFASVVGTTIEFFDFYIYATAAISVFPLLFFPKGEGTAALLASMATFGVAFSLALWDPLYLVTSVTGSVARPHSLVHCSSWGLPLLP